MKNEKMIYSKLLIPILLFTASCSTAQVETNGANDMKAKQKDIENEECSRHYLFDNEVIELEKMESVPIGGKVIDFKKCSKYAHRFESIISDTVYNQGVRYAIENDKKKKKYNLHIQQTKKDVKTIKLPVANPLPEVHEYYISLFPYKEFVIMYMRDMYSTHYTICKYDADGTLHDSLRIEHTYIEHPEPKTNHYKPYLEFHSLTASQMIFTSHMAFADKFVTRILDLNTFEITEYDKIAHGVILDENEEKLVGFVTSKKDYEAKTQPVHFEISMINGKTYSFDIDYADKACDFLLKDSLLYIGNYHPIATGSSLHCFDMRAGKIKWTADVLQVNASHSEYWNKVTLSMYKNKLIMQGDEANCSYLQIFDAGTGKRLAKFGCVWEEKK